MPRLASLCLPDLAIERIRRSQSPPDRVTAPERLLPPRSGHWRPGARWAREAPAPGLVLREGAGALVTSQREGNRELVAAASPEARALGLLPGMPLAKARLIAAGLDVRPADAAGDAAWLARLGEFAARRWTPRAAVSGADGLWLDLEGVAHLFGGEERMCQRILAFCRRLGFTARIAVAGSAGAAHALARFGGDPLLLCPPGGEATAIAPFPLAALRLEEEVLGRARRLGLERIGDVLALPRAPLQRRFGAALLGRLDQALGRAGEPFAAIVPFDAPAVSLGFVEPIATAEAIAEAAAEAVRRLVPLLGQAGLGVRRLLLVCARLDNEAQRIAVSCARASRDPVHLAGLLAAKVETIEPGFGIERLQLVAVRTEPLGAEPVAGELTGAAPPGDLAPLIDRLAVRLGARRLYRLGSRESDLPERSVVRLAPLAQPADWPRWPRPIRLLAPPEPVDQVVALLPDGAPRRFRWRGRAYHVAAADGPERLYGEWWRGAAEREEVRDYFQVEAEGGGRFWLFRRENLSWHMHGLFA
jgi:protein ImuB